MPRIAIVTGILLIVIALIYGFALDGFHPTALIPIGIGLPILVCGLLARDDRKRKHAMHAAAVFGLLGVLGSLRGAKKWPAILSGQPVESPNAAWEQLLLFLICGVFLVLCVNSFIAARRARNI